MSRSFRIATIFGIPVQVHWSFTLLFLLVIYMGKSKGASWAQIAEFEVVIIALFVCVLLHEFGHALSAKYYGIKTHDITILPIGGLARLNNLPEKPFQEFVVAIAGPAVNVVIYALIAVFLHFFRPSEFSFSDLEIENADNTIRITKFLTTLMESNWMLVVFNMIPAFPMDGGRVLRALLSMRFERSKATKVATLLGQIIAVGFLIYGLLTAFVTFFPQYSTHKIFENEKLWDFQPVIILISIFVFYTARIEYQDVKEKENRYRSKITDILRAHFTPLQTSDPMNTAIQELAKGNENHFLVFDDTHILRGVLLKDDILDAEKNQHFDGLISSYMSLNFEKTTSDATVKDVFGIFKRTNTAILPVFNVEIGENTEGAILGVIEAATLENFIEEGKIV
jgi:Zn-dependent protease